jgi:hypothetical protein
MKTDKFMYLPTMTEDEFTKNIGKDDFFRRFGNPAVIRTNAGEGYIVLSAELYDRIAELCGFLGTKELIEHES